MANKEKVFPMLFSKFSECFSYEQCSFAIQKIKEGAGRVVIYKEIGIINSYTLECSFCGCSKGLYKDFHFN